MERVAQVNVKSSARLNCLKPNYGQTPLKYGSLSNLYLLRQMVAQPELPLGTKLLASPAKRYN